MTHIRPFVLIMALCGAVLAASALHNQKFYDKAAEKVWNTEPQLFDVNKEIPDSMAAGHSAVVLTALSYIDVDLEITNNLHGDKAVTKRTLFDRKMVKLFDDAAVERFSKHEFGARKTKKAMYYKYGAYDNAFGARIYKPDGRVVDVDLSKAFAVTEGKEDKAKNAVKMKIDIPGLEPGDILDYFDYTEEWVQEFDLAPLVLTVPGPDPRLDYHIRGRFSPRATVEYRGFNGAVMPARGTDEKGFNTFSADLHGIEILSDKKFIEPMRQLPFYVVYTLNNQSKYKFIPRSSRGGGLYANLQPGAVYADISNALISASDVESTLPGKVKKIVSRWRKSHPDATNDEIIDMAWIAAEYVNRTDKNEHHDDFWVAQDFCKIVKDFTAPGDTVHVGFINSRHDVPTTELSNWRQPDFGPLIGSKLYLCDHINFLPGEYPGAYQGEQGGAYRPGKYDRGFRAPVVFSLPKSKAFQNRASVNIDLELDAADINAKARVSLSGAVKSLAGGLTSFAQWAAAAEDYLEVPEKNRYKVDADSVRAEEKFKEAYAEFKDIFMDMTDREPTDIQINSHGAIPGAPLFETTFAISAPGVVTSTGDELLVPVGRFFKKGLAIKGTERTRQLDIYLNYPRQYQYDIALTLPDGYTADEAALKALGKVVQNRIGLFYAEALNGEDGRVHVMVRNYFNMPLMRVDAWEQLLELTDAATAFNEAILVLKKS